MKPLLISLLAALPIATGSLGAPADGPTVPTPGDGSPSIEAPARPGDSVGQDASTRQRELADATNRYRTSKGLPALKVNSDISRVAQSWSERMASEDRMYHNPNYSQEYPQGWRRASENVLQNWDKASADDLVQQWANSPGHNRNMLDPAVTDLGVGVAVTGEGKLYATQNFAAY